MKEKNRLGGLTLPDFRIYYRIVMFKRVEYWHRIGILTRGIIKSPEVNSDISGQLTFHKASKDIQ
jgi:hypothetical protein